MKQSKILEFALEGVRSEIRNVRDEERDISRAIESRGKGSKYKIHELYDMLRETARKREALKEEEAEIMVLLMEEEEREAAQ